MRLQASRPGLSLTCGELSSPGDGSQATLSLPCDIETDLRNNRKVLSFQELLGRLRGQSSEPREVEGVPGARATYSLSRRARQDVARRSIAWHTRGIGPVMNESLGESVYRGKTVSGADQARRRTTFGSTGPSRITGVDSPQGRPRELVSGTIGFYELEEVLGR